MRFFVYFTLFISSIAATTPLYASSGPAHLISWAAQLYDMSMTQQEARIAHEKGANKGQQMIFERAKALLTRAEIEQWHRAPVILKHLEDSQQMAMQFHMQLGEQQTLRINWVEEHLNVSVEDESGEGFTFMLLGVINIEEQADGRVLLSITPHEDEAHYQFHNEKTQEYYFPGLIVDMEP